MSRGMTGGCPRASNNHSVKCIEMGGKKTNRVIQSNYTRPLERLFISRGTIMWFLAYVSPWVEFIHFTLDFSYQCVVEKRLRHYVAVS